MRLASRGDEGCAGYRVYEDLEHTTEQTRRLDPGRGLVALD